MSKSMRSYTSNASSTAGTWTEFRNLFKGVRRASANLTAEVDGLVGEIRRVEATLKAHYGFEAIDCDLLEVGVGQLPRQAAYFARNNRVTGIDLDVIPRGFNPNQYVQLWKSNGSKRLVKTIARKLLGVDRQFERELRHNLGVAELATARFLPMDATCMQFEDAAFDLIYSFNVFEHLPDPAKVLQEMKRVLRPGGCIVNHFHLYTSDSGCHDVRILSGDREGLAFWPHLRTQYRDKVRNAAYINELRMADWEPLFHKALPGCRIEMWDDEQIDQLKLELAELRSAGELAELSERELLSRLVVCYWQKP